MIDLQKYIKLEIWPTPQWGPYPEVFKTINSDKEFNDLILYAENRQIILKNSDLYYNWLLPHAILLFGKTWFNLLKYAGLKGTYGLFSQSEKNYAKEYDIAIENTLFGKARIANIIIKINSILIKYLTRGLNKPFGNYVIKSLNNELTTERGQDRGFKYSQVLFCPNCLSDKIPAKTFLQNNGTYLECPRCKELSKTLKLIGIDRSFEFTDFKKIPTKYVWRNNIHIIEDEDGFFQENCPCYYDVEECLTNLKYANLLLDCMILQLSKIKIKNITAVYNWCFNLAIIKWLEENWKDAISYFFNTTTFLNKNNKLITNGTRGKEKSIYQGIWICLMNSIEQNIHLFQKFGIEKVTDIKWLARPPKFTGGPYDKFESVVNFESVISKKLVIPNNTNIKQIGSEFKPRLAKLISIYKIVDEKVQTDYNYVQDVEKYSLNSILLNNLQKGDRFQVECLVMSGHHTHAPIQKISMLKKNVLKPFIKKIIEEEIDKDFWSEFRHDVQEARKNTGLYIKLSR